MTKNYLTALIGDSGERAILSLKSEKCVGVYRCFTNDVCEATERKCGVCSVLHLGAMFQMIESAMADCSSELLKISLK